MEGSSFICCGLREGRGGLTQRSQSFAVLQLKELCSVLDKGVLWRHVKTMLTVKTTTFVYFLLAGLLLAFFFALTGLI